MQADFDYTAGRVLKTRPDSTKEGKAMENMQTNNDVRLDETQQSIMETMIEGGMDEREAKLRVLCIAKPPDHFHHVPASGKLYPKMLYNADGRTKICVSAADNEVAKQHGWLDTASEIHVRNNEPKEEVAVPVFATKKKASAAR